MSSRMARTEAGTVKSGTGPVCPGDTGGAWADPGESQVVILTGSGGSGAGVGPVERSPVGSGRDRTPGWRRGRSAATSPASPMGVVGFFSSRSRGVAHWSAALPRADSEFSA